MTVVRVIAIDGAAGSGKSTLARGLARSLDLPYVNTGLMYRALTLAAIERGVDPGDGPALADLTNAIGFALDPGDPPELSIDDAPPSPELDGPKVEAHVSRVASHPEVRALMREEQRRLGGGGAVMEGRDIGSVVFPDAPMKIYLVADAEVRERRRALEQALGTETAPSLLDRDERDMKVNVFEPAPGGLVIDTTELDVENTVDAALRLIREHAPELLL
jgi:cytidylate kinase